MDGLSPAVDARCRVAPGDGYLVISYFLPAAPFPFVAVVLVAMALLTVTARGVACGVAAGTATLMIVFVLLQGPAVECGKSSVSGSSGPWWIDEPNQSTGYGTATATANGVRASGTVQVGERHYSYLCDNGRLVSFERLPEDVSGLLGAGGTGR